MNIMRINHDQLPDDPSGLVDVPSNAAVVALVLCLPLALVWMGAAWLGSFMPWRR